MPFFSLFSAVCQTIAQREKITEIEDCGNFDAAFYAAVRDAKEGDIVLMSPASAAFDQFKNFMVRGDHFKKLVKEL